MNLIDEVSPELARLIYKLRDKTPILIASGMALQSESELSWTDPVRRLTPWPPKKDGSEATLQKEGLLCKSLQLEPLSVDAIAVGTDRPYACAQNYGYEPRNLPARPYFPVDTSGEIAPQALDVIQDAVEAMVNHLLK